MCFTWQGMHLYLTYKWSVEKYDCHFITYFSSIRKLKKSLKWHSAGSTDFTGFMKDVSECLVQLMSNHKTNSQAINVTGYLTNFLQLTESGYKPFIKVNAWIQRQKEVLDNSIHVTVQTSAFYRFDYLNQSPNGQKRSSEIIGTHLLRLEVGCNILTNRKHKEYPTDC